MTAPGPGRRASGALGERPLAPGGRDRGSRHCVGTQGPDDCLASSVSVGEGFVEEGALLTGRRSGGGAGSGAGGQCPRRAGGPGRQRAEPQCPGPEVGARRHRTAHSSSSRRPSAGRCAHRAFPHGSGRFPGWWWPRGAASELGADLASWQSRASEWTGDALAVGPMSGFAGASSPATCPAGLSSHPCPAAGVWVEVSPSSAAAFRPVDYFLKVLRFRR